MKRLKPYEEVHFQGVITIENPLYRKHQGEDKEGIQYESPDPTTTYETGDIGIKIEADGRFWICVNGRAFVRAKAMDISVFEHQLRNADRGKRIQ